MPPRTLRALVADVGGTKTDLALYEASRMRSVQPFEANSIARPVRSVRYASAEQASLPEAALRFLGEDRVDIAVLAVAGPIENDRSQLTNLPWVIDRLEMQRCLHAPVELMNDFAALVHAAPLLGPGDLLSLSEAPRKSLSTVAVMGAGTGLGEGIGVWGGGALQVVASEGGHADFAPRDELEVRLWRYLKARHERATYEHVLSGRGLSTLYAFLRAEALGSEPARPEPPTPPNEVTARALHGRDSIAAQTLRLWLSIYGAEAGNIALRVQPEGGLFIAGGIAQRLGMRLLEGELIEAFRAKGAMRRVVERIPVDLMLRPDASLLGAWAKAVVIYNQQHTR